MMAVKPCPAGTYGVANITFGLGNSPCKVHQVDCWISCLLVRTRSV
jgi:hypothetical protein